MSPRPPDPVPLPPRMRAALEAYRKRVWGIKLAEGVLAGFCALAVSYLAVFGLDRGFDTPSVVRTVLLAAGSAGLILWLPWKCYRWVWRHRRLEQVTRLLRHKFPRFGDQLLGIVELAQAEAQREASPALVGAAMRQVDAELQQRDLRAAVPNPRHVQWLWAAGLPAALVLAVLAVVPAAGGNALARWAMPWRPIDRYTFAQLREASGSRVVPYAEPFTVRINLKEDSPWRPVEATARYGEQASLAVARNGLTYAFEIPPQTRAGRLTLRVGDARRILSVEPKTRPALTTLAAQIELPAYLQRGSTRVEEDLYGGTLRLVKESSVIFQATATRDLAAATLNGRSQEVEGPHLRTENVRVGGSSEYQLAWRDRFGLDAREPQVLRVEAAEDGAPVVGVNQLKHQQIILSTEVLAFEIQARDDFGIRQVGLEWESLPEPGVPAEISRGEKIVAAGGPWSDTLAVPATFMAEREGVSWSSVQLRAFAEDYLPDRERSYSPSLLLRVLTPAEHFRWLTERMSQWAGAAREVYEKELHLHQINEELMSLPPEALDDPARRKQIRDQAAAEMANATALDALIAAGTDWVREATRNEEFEANQLETWARMLQQLEAIAGDRMPRVAGLLARAAEAPGHSTAASVDGAQSPEADGQDGQPPGAIDHSRSTAARNPAVAEGNAPANPNLSVPTSESGFNASESPGQASPVQAGLGIPETVLRGGGDRSRPSERPVAPAAESVQRAVREQEDLLADFAKMAGEISELLTGFENSTFVKRLKAASRYQIQMAAEINQLEGFGWENDELENLPERESLGQREVAAAETVFTIQDDLMAYADRRPSENHSRVLGEMQSAAVVDQIREMASALRRNEVGQSTIEAEFWADTLDRWAEQLVDPPQESDPSTSEPEEQPSLTPAIVLEVLRIIHREILLREETRELDHARAAMEEPAVQARGGVLSRTQSELAGKARQLAEQIEGLPSTNESGREMLQGNAKKLTDAAKVMDEARALLAKPETGPPTLAALSEVIEILLESQRAPNTPVITRARSATIPALMLVGLGDDSRRVSIEERAPAQATGKSGRSLPEEFRQGLDVYLNALEGRPIE